MLSAPGTIPGASTCERWGPHRVTRIQWRSGGDYKEEQEHRDTETAKMRMPESEEGKVTATGGGLRASGLLKLGGIRRSLLMKGLFVHFAIVTTHKSSLPAPIFKQPSQHSLVHTWLTCSYSSRRGRRVSARGLTAHAYV